MKMHQMMTRKKKKETITSDRKQEKADGKGK